tara:strand:+ start:178 stop:1068 length:891 start_codon:yes stop_codon:yes gene_type:complete
MGKIILPFALILFTLTIGVSYAQAAEYVVCPDGTVQVKVTVPKTNCSGAATLIKLTAAQKIASKSVAKWYLEIKKAQGQQKAIILQRFSNALSGLTGSVEAAKAIAEKAQNLATQNQQKLSQVETKLNRVGMADCDHVREDIARYKKCLALADTKNNRVYESHQKMMGLYGMQLKQNPNLSMNFSCNDGKDCETNVGPTPASPMQLLARSYQTPPQPVAPAGRYSKTQWLAPVGLGLVVGGGFWLGHHLMADTGRTQVDFQRERVHWSESATIGLSAFALTAVAGYTYMFITDDDD